MRGAGPASRACSQRRPSFPHGSLPGRRPRYRSPLALLARSQAAVLSAAGHSRRHAARSLARREGGKQTRNGLPHARRNLHSRLTDLVLWAIKLWMLQTEFYLLKKVRSKKIFFFDSKKIFLIATSRCFLLQSDVSVIVL